MNNSDIYKLPGLKSVDDCIAESFEISSEELQMDTRKREIVDARKFAMWWQRKTFGNRKSFTAIGEMYAGRDHATALTAYRKDHPFLYRTDAAYRVKAQRALRLINTIKPVLHE